MPTPTTESGWERGANGVSQTPNRKEAEMNILKGIRPLDYALTAVMVGLAVLIGLENVNAGPDADLAHSLDSQSAVMVPVFVVAAMPILWRRPNILAAIGVSFAVIAASVPAFGWVTRPARGLGVLGRRRVADRVGQPGWLRHVRVRERDARATVVSTLLYLTPPTTMLWVFLMFGEPVPLVGLLGLAVSAAGVLLVLRGRRAVTTEPLEPSLKRR